SVGTTWDLKGNPQNRSAYADVVTSGRGNLPGSGGAGGKAFASNNNDDADYYGKSDGKTKKIGSCTLKKNWAYGKNGEIVYIPTGFVGQLDKPSAVGGGAAGSGSKTGTFHGTPSNSNYDGRKLVQKSSGPSVGTAWDLKPHTRSVYADVKK
uniref:Uncharacterized protein n=1 Tax=Panagrolaimus sp. PS1159 TaxID=55785 RepID=A0AC35GIT6_9BILA